MDKMYIIHRAIFVQKLTGWKLGHYMQYKTWEKGAQVRMDGPDVHNQ